MTDRPGAAGPDMSSGGRLRVLASLALLARLSGPYARSPERARAAFLLACALGLAVLSVYLNVVVNEWNGRFFNALQSRDAAGLTRELRFFLGLFLVLVTVSVQRGYVVQALQIRWRNWQTRVLLDRWLAARAAGRIVDASVLDNPDQRIAEDVRLFTTQTLDLAFGLVTTAMNFVAFLTILWQLSVGVTLGGVRVPGLMVWASLLYALLGIAVTDRFGRILVGLNFRSQAAEADLRFGLARSRAGVVEPQDGPVLAGRLGHVTAISWQLARRQKLLSFVTAGYGQFTLVFPYLLLAPQFMVGDMTLGALTQSVAAFVNVHSAISWPIYSYAPLTAWQATANRLDGLVRELS